MTKLNGVWVGAVLLSVGLGVGCGRSAQPVAVPVPVVLERSDAVLAAGLGEAVRFETVSEQAALSRHDNHQAAFVAFHRFLKRRFPHVLAGDAGNSVAVERFEKHSMLLHWPGSRPDLQPILLLAHMDVVPVAPEQREDWEHPPYGGVVADGYVWGRGTMDFKVGVMGILEAMEHLLASGYRPERSLYVALGHDEEVGGAGAVAMAKALAKRGKRFALVLDEGQVIADGMIDGLKRRVALLGLAEKGYLSVALTSTAAGGHSSMPPPQTAVGRLAAAVHAVQQTPMPASLSGPPAWMLETLAPEFGGWRRLVFANQWLFGPMIARKMTRSPATNALVRTTTAPTMLQAGVKENVLPREARAVVNFRVRPGDSKQGVLAHLRSVIDDPEIALSVLPIESRPSTVSRMDTPGYAWTARAIREVFPDVAVAPSLTVGATDARHYQGLSDAVLRFSPIVLRDEDRSRIHGVNERIAVADYGNGVRFYVRMIVNGTTDQGEKTGPLD